MPISAQVRAAGLGVAIPVMQPFCCGQPRTRHRGLVELKADDERLERLLSVSGRAARQHLVVIAPGCPRSAL